MRKKIVLIVAAILSVFLVGCSGKGYEIAMITDIGTVNDGSFNQGTWVGISKYAEENEISYKHYAADVQNISGYLDAIDYAIKHGAKIVICPGFTFESAIYEAQYKYPSVKFVLLDGEPHDESYANYDCAANTYSVFFMEQEAGFYAGYAAVKSGYTDIGFIGGIELPAVGNYGYGYLQGADYAAKELGISTINANYWYSGTFSASPAIQSRATEFYNSGTDIIFSCGGNILNSVILAAEASNKDIIGVDVDQYKESDTIVTSSMKQLGNSVYQALTDYYSGNFKGGQVVKLGTADEAVGISMEHSKLPSFSQNDYDTIMSKVLNHEIEITSYNDISSISDLPLQNVKLNYFE